MIVLDAAAIVNMLKPGSAKTFPNYARDVFLPYVKSQVDKAQRVDVVWDDYRPGTLKEQTWRSEVQEFAGVWYQRMLCLNTGEGS